MIPQELRSWLNERCPEEQLSSKDGVFYLPNHICEQKLDQMESKFGVIWNTRNYKSTLYQFDGVIWTSASLELVLEGEGWRKVLVGCATFKHTTIAPNTHFDATAKSFCTVNAAMDLGDQFGRFLSEQNTPKTIEITKQKPSMIELKKFEGYIKKKNYKALSDLADRFDFVISDDVRSAITDYRNSVTTESYG